MNKGFTLVELLAVIIILAVLITLTSTSVTKVVKNSKEDLSSSQIKLIESAAKNWGAENMNKLPKNGECKFLTLKDLSEYGYINSDIIDPNTNKKIDKDLKIKISSEINKQNKNIITYEVDSKVITSCSHASPCILLEGAAKEFGSKYECEVKPGTKYNFYVLSHEDDGTTNLIMNRNIYYNSTNDIGEFATPTNLGITTWRQHANLDDNSYGPVTAMNYIFNTTKDWTNIPNLQIDYTDEGNGYGKIKTTNNITKITKKDGTLVTVLTNKEGYANLKARMPSYDEVHGIGKCLTYLENNNRYGSCPLWLVNYLSSSSYVTGTGLQNISGIEGYWTFSSYDESSGKAWHVSYRGSVEFQEVNYAGNWNYGTIGVRPVINVEL